jgi:hypothetical protein
MSGLPSKSRAKRDFLRQCFAELPSADEFLWQLPLRYVDALRNARKAVTGENAGCYRVPDDLVHEMQALGLVGCGTPYLGSFGHNVRRRVLALDAAK